MKACAPQDLEERRKPVQSQGGGPTPAAHSRSITQISERLHRDRIVVSG